MCSQIYSNIIQVFTLFMKAIFSQVRHPSHPGRGHASPTCHMTQFEQSDWLRSENFINIMIEYTIIVKGGFRRAVLKTRIWNISYLKYIYYNNRIWNVFILYIQERMTTFGAANGEDFVKMTIFPLILAMTSLCSQPIGAMITEMKFVAHAWRR